ncbi:MAG: NADPH-dependent 2,4-dienoyl-CoA reductase, partial [Spirochaetia bacterium]|nr:NADPH-dependent 2,4-dienoyl-CoA reductase [Spirochaetia bacterium]
MPQPLPFQPFPLGNITLPNRVIMGSMHLGLEKESSAAQQMADFYNKRFQGGAGFITTGGIAVNEEGMGSLDFFQFQHKQHQLQLQRLVELTKTNGFLCAQLFHAGRYAYHRNLVAPSAIRAPINRYKPRELTAADIKKLISDFTTSAAIAQQTGFAAIEIMGSEGYLLNEFFSPVTNKRTDRYAQPSLLYSEIMESVRSVTGPGFPVIVRMSGIDLIAGNPGAEQVILLAQALEKAGASALNIGIGWHESKVPTISSLVPPAAFVPFASRIKQQVTIPIIASNRINSPDLIFHILQNNQADLISMARPFLADAEFINKMQSGNAHSINTCIACNQACLDHTFSRKRVSCLVNPLANTTVDFPNIHTKKNITIAGAGPAGLQIACQLAKSGTNVELLEATGSIGGQMNLAAKIPGKKEFLDTIRYFRQELKRLGVSVLTNTSLDPSSVQSDALVVATGSMPNNISIEGLQNISHCNYREFLENKTETGKNILIIGGGAIGCDIAYSLLAREKSAEEFYQLYNIDSFVAAGIQSHAGEKNVHLFRRNGKIGQGLGITTGWALLQELQACGAGFHSGLSYEYFNQDGLTVRYHNGETAFFPGENVILCAGQTPSIPHDLQKFTKGKIYLSGSAKNIGDAKQAFADGL